MTAESSVMTAITIHRRDTDPGQMSAGGALPRYTENALMPHVEIVATGLVLAFDKP